MIKTPLARPVRSEVSDAAEQAALPGAHSGVASRLMHVPALDGVRGLAILWVMLFHMAVIPPVGAAAKAWHSFARHGGLGVDVFFVLSGFLITGILLDTKQSSHYLRNFYARRVLRIFPLYYAVVFFSLVILPHVTRINAAKFEPATRDSLWYWLHLSNFAIARRGAFTHGILDVSWSLSIEEQFYLFWPVVVWRTRPPTLVALCALLITSSCISRIVLTRLGFNPVAVYTLTFCRLDGLGVGALLALFMRAASTRDLARSFPLALLGAMVILGLTFAPYQAQTAELLNVGLIHTGVALLAAASILGTLGSASRLLSSVLTLTPLRALGRFSYAIYLFHYPLMAALRDTILRPSAMPLVLGSTLPAQLGFDVIATLISILAAFISWHAYEKWFLRLKRYF